MVLRLTGKKKRQTGDDTVGSSHRNQVWLFPLKPLASSSRHHRLQQTGGTLASLKRFVLSNPLKKKKKIKSITHQMLLWQHGSYNTKAICTLPFGVFFLLFVLKAISTLINRPAQRVQGSWGRARLQEHFPVFTPTCKLHNKRLQHFLPRQESAG